jgi:hypothetical protein
VKVKGEGEQRRRSSSYKFEFEKASSTASAFENRLIRGDHSLQTVVTTKSTTVSNRFLALHYLSQSLPNLPPHFAKCGGN